MTLSPLIKVHGCSDCSPHWNSLSLTVVAADNDQTDISRQSKQKESSIIQCALGVGFRSDPLSDFYKWLAQ